MTIQRRSFIQKASIAAGVAAFSPHVLLAATRPKKEKLGVALVGLGYYSTDLLAPALQKTKYCELKGIVTGSADKIPTWQQKYGIADKNVYSYDTYEEIANNPDIDVIYVVLPPSMHKEYTVRGANIGKHMWCEKPMAPSVNDCQAMIEACEKNKVGLAIGYRCQHDPNIQAYRKVVKEQKFGKVKLLQSAAGYVEGRTNHWKQKKAMGGGVMGDMGVYAIQGARMATGEEPISVRAITSTTRPEIYHEVEETAAYVLEFPSGAIATCQSSFGANMNYLQVNYEKGWLKMEPQTGYGGNRGSMSDGTEIYTPVDRQQPLQLDDDALAIMQGKPYLAPGEEGLRDIRVVEAVLKSGASGGCEVKIN
ncbi:Gfo/Idh/MocA family oxidoreductase [Marinilongibacter aquaticus]|uniref:Gfo/Idh/MocA family protein n=1 Tax=Marinilongibacter aquaticus TaxID=2975157 RepID=UPI0021BD7A23|nr:Gfo/Idh/MocA family oxidoreductase [Marinilongibacter aquaticus]UBM57544.1 Gfo/Idh/MocA family oxidoreductase [Marinilongibacter aquaticus]